MTKTHRVEDRRMRKAKQKMETRSATKRRRSGADTWVGDEIELIIREREWLLRTAGAAATLFSALNIRDFPREAREPMRRLGVMLGSLPDETLTDAIEQLLGPASMRSRARAAL